MPRHPALRALQVPTLAVLACATLAALPGCGVFGVASKVGEAIESEKQVEVLARYRGLENKSIAVVVNADRSVLYEYPTVVPYITSSVAGGIRNRVSGVKDKVMPPAESLGWCYRTPSWTTLPLGQVADDLRVDRVVVIDIYEFRLNPPGNRWLWDGMAAANVGIIERDSLDPDAFVEEYSVAVKFPEKMEIGRESAREEDVLLGLTAKFAQTITKLFYDHLEAKYPDRKLNP
jgi:hypothetical protein